MNIFNSLGSNYNFFFVIQALLAKNNNYSVQLKTLLENKYGGKPILVYKGREALQLALTSLGLPTDSQVAITGYTCYAVYKAIINANCHVVYIDVDTSDLNFSAENLRKTLKSHPDIKVLVIQNTLGYPSDIEEIAKLCKQKNITIIEDLAHSIGTRYLNNKEAGTVGDFTVLSFSQDKMIDGISGGALIIRNNKWKKTVTQTFHSISQGQQWKDRFYPLFTFIIRKTYFLGLGKLIHILLKNTNLLSKPMGDKDTGEIHHLPDWYCSLIYEQFKALNSNIAHRQKIADVYSKIISHKLFFTSLIPFISSSSNLRFPITVRSRENLIKYLKKAHIHLSDIWYDAPIAPKKYMSKVKYHHDCPTGEDVAKSMINLPTHKNMTIKQAIHISKEINTWLQSQ